MQNKLPRKSGSKFLALLACLSAGISAIADLVAFLDWVQAQDWAAIIDWCLAHASRLPWS